MKELNIPYFSQTDNQRNPSGSCNVTSIAMGLHYLGIRGNGQGQLEDQCYQRMEANGWSRHSPQDLARLVESYGCRDQLTLNGSLADIEQSIDQGKPVVIHGYFTTFGHIIVIKGYDRANRQFIVHDPWGEWYSTGYDRNDSRNPAKGKDQRYSYGLISRLCSPESEAAPKHIWLHRLSR